MTMTPDQLLEKVRERQLRKAEIDKHEAAITDLNAAIGAELAVRGVTKLEVGEWAVLDIEVSRDTLVETKLLEQGVSPEQIAKAKVRSVSRQLRVNKRQG